MNLELKCYGRRVLCDLRQPVQAKPRRRRSANCNERVWGLFGSRWRQLLRLECNPSSKSKIAVKRAMEFRALLAALLSSKDEPGGGPSFAAALDLSLVESWRRNLCRELHRRRGRGKCNSRKPGFGARAVRAAPVLQQGESRRRTDASAERWAAAANRLPSTTSLPHCTSPVAFSRRAARRGSRRCLLRCRDPRRPVAWELR